MKHEVRDQWFMDAARQLHDSGIQPTGRKILSLLNGGSPRDYPAGLSGEDSPRYRRCMRALGYVQHPKTGQWHWPASCVICYMEVQQ